VLTRVDGNDDALQALAARNAMAVAAAHIRGGHARRLPINVLDESKTSRSVLHLLRHRNPAQAWWRKANRGAACWA